MTESCLAMIIDCNFGNAQCDVDCSATNSCQGDTNNKLWCRNNGIVTTCNIIGNGFEYGETFRPTAAPSATPSRSPS